VRTPAPNRQPRRGLALVESAAVISIAFLMIFGIFEYGRFLMVANVMEHAAREGARYAVLQSSLNPSPGSQSQTAYVNQVKANIIQRVKDKMGPAQHQISNLQITVTALDQTTGADAGDWDDAKHTQPVAVRITGTYKPVTFIIDRNVPVRAQASMGSEAN
jgi:Flp pilus assembly protein TadG